MRLLTIVFVLMSTVATAQTTAYSVGVFGPAVTNPATATPIIATTYPVAAIPCNQSKLPESPQPIINPTEGRFDDPANAARDCALTLTPTVQALPTGTGYTVAMRTIAGVTLSAWSPLSSMFAVSTVQAHPCDGAAPNTGGVSSGSRTLSWCFNGLDASGGATTITSWAVYVDGVRSVLSGVTIGATANVAGLKQYQAALTLTAGTHVLQIAGLNATGEAVKSPSFTASVTTPAAVPSVAVIRGIQ